MQVFVTRTAWVLLSFAVPVLSLAVPGIASGAELNGYVGLEGRYFNHQPLFAEQSEHSASLAGYLEFYHDTEDTGQRVAMTLFGRADSADEERTHTDIRELYWWKGFESFEIYTGIRKVFWGVTESVHLVDIINQDDVVENLDREEKLGQPMVQLVNQRNWGLLEFFLLPYFREQQLPGEEGRLRPRAPIIEDAVYQSGAEERHLDYAFRWSHYVDVWDLSLSHFSGTSRDPVYQPEYSGAALIGLRPHYQQIEQTGLAVQATVAAWLWKLELASVYEHGYGRNSAAVGGFEFSLFSIGGTSSDLGLIAEYQFDDRTGFRQPVSQNDLAMGFRWAFNDIDSSEILWIASLDLDNGNRFYSLEVNRRITDNWKIEAEARFFSDTEPGTAEYDLRGDDYLQVEVRRYF